MKATIIVIAIIVIGFLFYKFIFAKLSKITDPIELQYEKLKLLETINIVDFQDASGSIKENGVELITSSVFNPYYKDTHRDIQLSFGIINNLTAKKLISVELKAARYRKPIIPDWANVPFSDQNELKRKYLDALLIYQRDSLEYSLEREQIFTAFSVQVDSEIDPYKSRLSKHTDLVTAMKIADKVFNYCFAGNAANYLLLNSDGLDSYKRRAQKLTNKAEVILINANGNVSTSVDSIITKSLQSTEQAIEFTLNNHN